ncbi:hypothetical protein MUK42_33837 [Musa troglodytarum]|uniref:Uncharacterized protein n=1 Tax=Musa troglodytarum TaxID=320322 RepID=A0A9E7GM48_9LILI|nr:hypothetical protein MUK42_33837 [Musa troglodytarum]
MTEEYALLQNNEGLLQTKQRMTSIVARMFVKMTPQLLMVLILEGVISISFQQQSAEWVGCRLRQLDEKWAS